MLQAYADLWIEANFVAFILGAWLSLLLFASIGVRAIIRQIINPDRY